MCLIIDANCLGKFLQEPPNEDSQPIHTWMQKRGKLVYATEGKFSEEIGKEARERLDEYSDAGIARFVDKDTLSKELRTINKRIMKSDDEHVIALAKAANVKLLYTHDRNLMDDFKNSHLIQDGKVYSGKRNKNLLRPDTCP